MAVTVYAQAPAPAPGAQAPKAPPAQAPAEQERAFTGALVKVDTAAKVLTAKGADDKEMQFTYTDATQVVGAEKTIQGLAGKTGAQLRITYRVQEGKNHATRIEMTQ
jgi:hypothetical protein